MNREIKFKLYFFYEDGNYTGYSKVYTLEDLMSGSIDSLMDDANYEIFDGLSSYDSYEENLVYFKINKKRFTGLKDKNGVEIYEGDVYETQVLLSPKGVSKVHNITYWVKVKCVVCFEDGSFVGRYSIDNDKFLAKGITKIKNNIEVIGNKFENPELKEK